MKQAILIIVLGLAFAVNAFAAPDLNSTEGRLIFGMETLSSMDISRPSKLDNAKIMYINIVRQLDKAKGINNPELIKMVMDFYTHKVVKADDFYSSEEERYIAQVLEEVSLREAH